MMSHVQAIVIGGALLYVFGKGAKFSLFKPAEEMVYITLDEDGRTRGKAAIDVVGAQVWTCFEIRAFMHMFLSSAKCMCFWRGVGGREGGCSLHTLHLNHNQ